MSITNGKPFEATAKQLNLKWGGGSKNFRCGFCGYVFKEGDVVRWVFTNNTKAWGNPFICQNCDNPEKPQEAVKLWIKKSEEFNKFIKSDEWWWFKHHNIDIPKENAEYGMR